MDISSFKIDKFKYYSGGNGSKLCLKDSDGRRYLLKTPPSKFNINKNKIYTNGCVSEYIGCHIFESLGFKTQETNLVIYPLQGKNKLCCLCRDFEDAEKKRLFEFASIKNSILDSSENGYGVELSEVLETIDSQNLLDPITVKEFFWDMFIADAFLGNFDRHNGNWGFLIDESKNSAEIAPVYDCGSCLYPQMPEDKMLGILNNQIEVDKRIYVFPNSALKIEGRKINYFDFISSGVNQDCTDAFLRIYYNVDMNEIHGIIENTPYISETQKEFYTVMLDQRKEKILDKSYELLVEKNIIKEKSKYDFDR